MEIPRTASIQQRPVWRRHLLRQDGNELLPPSDEEIADAIAVLRQVPLWDSLDKTMNKAYANVTGERFVNGPQLSDLTEALVLEAERIHEEASRS